MDPAYVAPNGADPPPDRVTIAGAVARNTLLNHHRRRLRDARLGEKLAAALADVVRPAHDGDDRVRAALDALPARDRELLTLTAWDGLNSDQVAAVVGLTPNAVRVALHRARQRLRLALADTAPVPCPDVAR